MNTYKIYNHDQHMRTIIATSIQPEANGSLIVFYGSNLNIPVAIIGTFPGLFITRVAG